MWTMEKGGRVDDEKGLGRRIEDKMVTERWERYAVKSFRVNGW